MIRITFILFLTFGMSMLAQEKHSPTIIILNSQETVISKELDSIAEVFKQKVLSKIAKENIRKENGDFKLKAEKEIVFLEEMDISTNITYGLNYFLSYKFFEYFENLLIYPVKEYSDSSLENLKNISEKYDVNWIVNIKRINFFTEGELKKAKVQFQVYNQKSNTILLEKEINANDSNPGFEFSCEEKTINCVINNSISKMSSEIISLMGQHKDYWR